MTDFSTLNNHARDSDKTGWNLPATFNAPPLPRRTLRMFAEHAAAVVGLGVVGLATLLGFSNQMHAAPLLAVVMSALGLATFGTGAALLRTDNEGVWATAAALAAAPPLIGLAISSLGAPGPDDAGISNLPIMFLIVASHLAVLTAWVSHIRDRRQTISTALQVAAIDARTRADSMERNSTGAAR
ncbi:MAG: hypothetical protein H7123_06835 [Thermoleophilia bacterium]|nr:hypothetical protein [Thermoleophilia bacterium]